jgi:hypothetical protein
MDLTGYVNTVITHITDGNKSEKRLVSIMGGTIIESESERLIRVGEERGEERVICSLIETCQEVGLSISDTTEKLISKFGLSEKASMTKVMQYWK